MSNLVEQLPALIGVIVGAAGSYATLHFSERARWRRELRVRWDPARLAAYTQYGEAIKSMFHIILRIAAGHGAAALVAPLDPEAGWPQYAEAEERRTRTWETMLMLGDPATIAAARTLHQSVWRLEQVARQPVIELAEWDSARLAAAESRDHFYACARASLGVSGQDRSADLWDALTWLPRQQTSDPISTETAH